MSSGGCVRREANDRHRRREAVAAVHEVEQVSAPDDRDRQREVTQSANAALPSCIATSSAAATCTARRHAADTPRTSSANEMAATATTAASQSHTDPGRLLAERETRLRECRPGSPARRRAARCPRAEIARSAWLAAAVPMDAQQPDRRGSRWRSKARARSPVPMARPAVSRQHRRDARRAGGKSPIATSHRSAGHADRREEPARNRIFARRIALIPAVGNFFLAGSWANLCHVGRAARFVRGFRGGHVASTQQAAGSRPLQPGLCFLERLVVSHNEFDFSTSLKRLRWRRNKGVCHHPANFIRQRRRLHE